MTLTRTLVLVAVLLAAGCSSSPDPGPTRSPIDVPAISQAERKAAVGEAVEIAGWKITVKGQECGVAASLLTNGDDADHAGSVCVIGISYVNSGSVPARFDETGPDFWATDGSGKRYDGTRWLRGEVNPGVADENELVFDVPSGGRLLWLHIGDVRVNVSA